MGRLLSIEVYEQWWRMRHDIDSSRSHIGETSSSAELLEDVRPFPCNIAYLQHFEALQNGVIAR